MSTPYGYTSDDELRRDMSYVLKKLNLSEPEFRAYLARPSRGHSEFFSEYLLLKRIYKIFSRLPFILNILVSGIRQSFSRSKVSR